MLNWKLMKNPLNWLIILLMLVIAGIGGHLLLSYFNHEPATDNSVDGKDPIDSGIGAQ